MIMQFLVETDACAVKADSPSMICRDRHVTLLILTWPVPKLHKEYDELMSTELNFLLLCLQ